LTRAGRLWANKGCQQRDLEKKSENVITVQSVPGSCTTTECITRPGAATNQAVCNGRRRSRAASRRAQSQAWRYSRPALACLTATRWCCQALTSSAAAATQHKTPAALPQHMRACHVHDSAACKPMERVQGKNRCAATVSQHACWHCSLLDTLQLQQLQHHHHDPQLGPTQDTAPVCPAHDQPQLRLKQNTLNQTAARREVAAKHTGPVTAAAASCCCCPARRPRRSLPAQRRPPALLLPCVQPPPFRCCACCCC
jgi:hypothetical protein